MSFDELLRKESNKCTFSTTENGAIGFSTSGKSIVDLNFKISSYRGMSDEDIASDFNKAFEENPLIAMKFLFFASDVRYGLGERRFFKVCLRWLEKNHPEYVSACLDLIPEYSRWDNMFDLIDTSLDNEVISLIKRQLNDDIKSLSDQNCNHVSLLGKWLPSVNTSSKATRNLARKIAYKLGLKERDYRKTLSSLRGRIGIVESKMSEKLWDKIEYSYVPSKANIKYSRAFLRNDFDRRVKFIKEANEKNVKINSSVNFPHEIIKMMKSSDDAPSMEALWKNLPDYLSGKSGRIITVIDTSFSMMCSSVFRSSNGPLVPYDIAKAIGIYFSERLEGEFKDKLITFSKSPKYIDLSSCKDLYSKVSFIDQYKECSNTDIYKVFRLILNTAKINGLRQDEIPDNVLIISDMEFDASRVDDDIDYLFEKIKKEYSENGYLLPKLSFWNICSRNCAFPVQENENGLSLISGFSPSVVSMILSNEKDPFKVLLEKLNSKRYDEIERRIKALK